MSCLLGPTLIVISRTDNLLSNYLLHNNLLFNNKPFGHKQYQ